MIIRWSVYGQSQARVDQYVAALIGVSRQQVKSLIQANHVLVNGQAVRPSQKLNQKDACEVTLPSVDVTPLPDIITHTDDCIATEQFRIDILFQDDDLIVINKPAGLLVHEGHLKQDDHVVAMLQRAGVSLYLTTEHRAGIVHRLDQYTEGVLVLVKSKPAFDFLKQQFKDRHVSKSYYAVLKGVPNSPEGVIDRPIGRDQSVRARRSCHHFVPGSEKHAVTKYRVIKATTNTSIVDIDLITGRTHQIRVHFAALQCPVLGDALYSSQQQKIDGYMLQSYGLAFDHPITKERVQFSLPMSDRLKRYA